MPTRPTRYDPNYLCTALLGGHTVMTPDGPVCDIKVPLMKQVAFQYAPYTLSPSLLALTPKSVSNNISP